VLTVRQALELYEPVTKRDNDSAKSDEGRAGHLLRHMGDRRVVSLTVGDVDTYRMLRLAEVTQRRKPPSPAQLDREMELWKQMLNYAVAAGKLEQNPIAKAKLLRRPNVRRVVIEEAQFQKLLAVAEVPLKPILLTAYDTGMRKMEVLRLKWSQVDLKAACIRLTEHDTKTDEGRPVMLTSRVVEGLKAIPRQLPPALRLRKPRQGEALEGHPQNVRTRERGGGARRRLVPRWAAGLHHSGTPCAHPRERGDAHERAQDQRPVPALQRGGGRRLAPCGRATRSTYAG
jgi:integrase